MALRIPQSRSLGALARATSVSTPLEDNVSRRLDAFEKAQQRRTNRPPDQQTALPQQPVAPQGPRDAGPVDAIKAFGAGALQLPRAAMGLLDIAPGLVGMRHPLNYGADALSQATGLAPFDYLSEKGENIVNKELSQETLAGRQAISSAEGFGGTLKAVAQNKGAAGTMLAESVPSILASGTIGKGLGLAKTGIGAITRAAAGEGAVAGGQAMADFQDAGVDTQRAAVAAGATAITTGTLGAVGGKISKALGLNDLDVLLARNADDSAAAKSAKSFLGRVVGGAAAEGIFEEMPQSAVEQMLANFAESKPILEGVEESAAMGLVLGGVLGGGVNILPGRGAKTDEQPAPVDLQTEEGQNYSVEALSQLSDEQLLKEENQLIAARALLLDAPEDVYANEIGKLNTRMQILSSVIRDKGLDPETRDLTTALKNYSALSNKLSVLEEQLATAKTPIAAKRTADAIRKTKQRLETIKSQHDSNVFESGLAQNNFNELTLKAATNRRALERQLANGDENAAAVTQATLTAQEESLQSLARTFPEIAYTGSEEDLRKAATGSKNPPKQKLSKEEKKQVKANEKIAQANEKIAQTRPDLVAALEQVNEDIREDAREGLADEANQEKLAGLESYVASEDATAELRAAALENARGLLDQASQGNQRNAEKLRAAEVAIIEAEILKRGEALPEQQAAPESQFDDMGDLDTIVDEIIKQESATGAVDIPTVALQNLNDSLGFKDKKGNTARLRMMRAFLSAGPREWSLASQNKKDSWKKRLGQRLVDQVQAAGLDAGDLVAERRAKEIEALQGDELVTALVVEDLKAGIENAVAAGENAAPRSVLNADRTKLTSTLNKFLKDLMQMSPEERVNKYPKKDGPKRRLWEAFNRVQAQQQLAESLPPAAATAPAATESVAVSPELEAVVEAVETPPEFITPPSDAGTQVEDIPTEDAVDDTSETLFINWATRGEGLTRTGLSLDDQIAVRQRVNSLVSRDEQGDLILDVEPDWSPLAYFSLLMGTDPQEALDEVTLPVYMEDFTDDVTESIDATIIRAVPDAVRLYRGREFEGLAARDKDFTPIDPFGAEAGRVFSALDMTQDEETVANYFFDVVLNKGYRSGREITEAIASAIAVDPLAKPMERKVVNTTLGTWAEKVFDRLATLRGMTPTEARRLIPPLAEYVYGETAEKRFSGAYWGKEYAKMLVEKAKLIREADNLVAEEDRLPETATAEERLDIRRRIRDKRTEADSLEGILEARRAFMREENYIRANDKRVGRFSLFLEEQQVSTSLEIAQEGILSDRGSRDPAAIIFDEEIDAELASAVEGQTEQDYDEIMSRMQSSVGGRTLKDGQGVYTITANSFMREMRKRTKRAAILKSSGWSDEQVRTLFMLEVQQEFLTRSVDYYSIQLQNAMGNFERAGVEPQGDVALFAKNLWEGTSVEKKDAWSKLIEYPRLLSQYMVTTDAIQRAEKLTGLPKNWVEAVLNSRLLEAAPKAPENLTKLKRERELLRATQSQIVDSLSERMRVKDKKVALSNALVVPEKEVRALVNRYARILRASGVVKAADQRQFSRAARQSISANLAKARKLLVDSWVGAPEEVAGARLQAETQLKNAFKELDKVVDNAVTTLTAAQVNESANTIRQKLNRMGEGKRRDLLLKAQVIETAKQLRSPSQMSVVDEAADAEKMLADAKVLQRQSARMYRKVLAEAEGREEGAAPATPRESAMEAYKARQLAWSTKAKANRDAAWWSRMEKQEGEVADRKKTVKENIERRAKKEGSSIVEMLDQLRRVNLHDVWIEMLDGSRMAIAANGKQFTAIENEGLWDLYEPTSPDGKPNTSVVAGELVRTFNSAEELEAAVADPAWLREQLANSNGRFFTAEMMQGYDEESRIRMARAYEEGGQIGRTIRLIELQTADRVGKYVREAAARFQADAKAAATEQELAIWFANSTGEITDEQREFGEDLPAVKGGETATYKAIQNAIGDVTNGTPVQLQDLADRMTALIEHPVTPHQLAANAADKLFGPTPEGNDQVEQPIESNLERTYFFGRLSVGNPGDRAKLVYGEDALSSKMLRQRNLLARRFNTESFVRHMTIKELREMLAEADIPFSPRVDKIPLLAGALEAGRNTEQPNSQGALIHAPILNISPVGDTGLLNAEVAEAWAQVMGESYPIPVLVHKAASETTQAERDVYSGLLLDEGDAHFDAVDTLKASRVRKVLKDAGFVASKNRRNGITVVQSRSDLAKDVMQEVGEDAVGPDVKALYVASRNHIYLVADNLRESSVLGAVAHELSHKVFSDEEIKALADLIRMWATGSSVEGSMAKAALGKVESSLQFLRDAGREVGQREADQEAVAYFIEGAVAKHGIRYGDDAAELSPAMKEYLNTGKSGEGVNFNSFMTALKYLMGKAFKSVGGTSPEAAFSRISATDFINALTHKGLNGRKARTEAEVYASIATDERNMKRAADSFVDKLPPDVRDVSSAFATMVGRAGKFLSFTTEFVRNNAKVFEPVERLGNKDPLTAMQDAKIRRSRTATVILEDIQNILAPLSTLSEKRQRIISAFMERSTREKAWGFVPDWANAAQPEIQSDELFAEFATLTPVEQKLVKDIFRKSQELRDDFDIAMEDSIRESYAEDLAAAPDEGARTDIMLRLEAELSMFRKMRGPKQAAYLKLEQRGNWAVIFMSQELRDAQQPDSGYSKDDIATLKGDGNHYFVAFTEGKAAAEKMYREMSERYDPAFIEKPFLRLDQNYRAQMPEGLFQAVEQQFESLDMYASENEGVRPTVRALKQALHKVYVEHLSENDLRKSTLGRENVETPPQDILGTFARNAKQLATQTAAVRTNQDVQRALGELTRQAMDKDLPGRPERMLVLDEALRRHNIDTTWQENPKINALLSATSFRMLLTSPAYYMQNMMQPIMYTLPKLLGEFGGNPATMMKDLVVEQKRMAEIFWKASEGQSDTDLIGRFQGKLFDTDLIKDPGERDVMNQLVDLNLLDVGINSDMGRVQTPGVKDARFKSAQPALDMYRKLFQMTTGAVRTVEIVNRGSTGLVSYRKAYARNIKKMSPEQAHQKAKDYAVFMVRRTQGDYSFGNQPSAFRWGGDWIRIATQFRPFQVVQMTIMIEEFRRALKRNTADPVERAAAKRTLFWLFGTHGAFAGALGLPFMFASSPLGIAYLLSKALGDEEEPDDLEYLVYERLGVNPLTDVLLHGFPSLLGINATNKLGFGAGLVTPYLDIELTREYPALFMGTVLTGASGGMAGNILGGLGLMGQGYFVEGAARAALPKGARDFVLGMYEANKGIRKYNPTRDELVAPEDIAWYSTTAKMLGWQPLQSNDQIKTTLWQRELRENFRATSSRLQGEFVNAVDDRDPVRRRKALREWREYQARRAKAGFQRQGISTLTAALKRRNQRVQNTSSSGVQYENTERNWAKRFERQ